MFAVVGNEMWNFAAILYLASKLIVIGVVFCVELSFVMTPTRNKERLALNIACLHENVNIC